MRIWVDLDNAPHVPFFKPLLRVFADRGYSVDVTLRDFGFTRSLAESEGILSTSIGSHPGANLLAKVASLGTRSLRLASWARGRGFDVAVSHGSRALVIAAKLAGIPSVTMFDYEHVSSGLFEKLSTRLLLPASLKDLFRTPTTRFYEGYKEEVYLGDFEPPDRAAPISVPDGKICIVIRPPATTAHYHDSRSERVLQAVLDRISDDDQAFGVIAPRTSQQGEMIANLLQNPLKFHILQRSVNGLDLVWQADLVVGGGGTMNREAALLGVPTYSIFSGPKGVIDRQLEKEGRISFLDSPEDVTKIKVVRRSLTDSQAMISDLRIRSESLRRGIVDEIALVSAGQ